MNINKIEMGILEYGQAIEKTLLKMLRQTMGWKVYFQHEENFSEVDGILQGDDLKPIQIKALTPRFLHRDVGFTHKQWKRYKKYSERYPGFNCLVLTTCYNPALDFDYKIYEFNFKTTNFFNQDSEFVYVKLDKMNETNIKIPEDFQRLIEKFHKQIIRPTIRPDLVGGCKDKF